MSDLLATIVSGKELAPRRTLAYGIEGIGKSSLAADAPSPIFIQTEEGLNDIDCDKFPKRPTTFEEVMECIYALYQGEHSYKNVVLDTADAMERLVWDRVCREKNKNSIEDIGYQKGYIFALEYWKELLEGLDKLREKGMGVIIIAHAEIKTFKNPEGEDYDRYVPKLHKFAIPILQEWADEVFFATYKVFVKQAGEGFKKAGKAIGTGERVLRTTASPTANAKNRLGMPPEIPLLKDNPWAAYAAYFPQAKKKEVKAKEG